MDKRGKNLRAMNVDMQSLDHHGPQAVSSLDLQPELIKIDESACFLFRLDMNHNNWSFIGYEWPAYIGYEQAQQVLFLLLSLLSLGLTIMTIINKASGWQA
jgi:hypothetical protein